MKKSLVILTVLILNLTFKSATSRSWCKAVYMQDTLPGELQKQISKALHLIPKLFSQTLAQKL